MANPEHVEIVRQGKEVIDAWREAHPLESLDLREASLAEASLEGAHLEGAHLEGAHLEGAHLIGAHLEGAHLIGAHLDRAFLLNADLAGARLVEAHLAGAHLGKADLAGAYLIGAYLVEARLAGADLAGAHLDGAHLDRAHLAKAHLAGAHLAGADLAGAHLAGAHLTGAHLAGAHLERANLAGANLVETNLTGANLAGANLTGANLRKAHLTGANLTLSRFIRCNLDDAVVANAVVTDVDVQNLRGLPKPPETLRLDVNGTEVVLTGSEAKEFFHLPAIVEVYVTTELTQQELGCYHFHLSEVHHASIATGVYLVGHRHEGSGSVLRFQAKSYNEIYQVLPDLLAPFRMSQAVDWKQTIQSIPAEERGEAITALAIVEPKPPMVEWHFAKRMAEIFDGYRNANVTQISEWGSRRIHIDIIENPDEVQRLSKKTLPAPWDEHKSIHIETGGGPTTIQLTEGDYVVSSSPQHFYGGHFQGCSFGDHNSLTNYFGVIDKLDTVEEDIKQKLKEAREAIENSDLPNDDKADAVEQLNNLTAELEKPEKDESRVKRYWNRIKEVAPTGASILASAASLAKLLGGG